MWKFVNQEHEMGAHITSHPSMLIIDVSVSVKDFAGVTITFKTSEVNCRTLSKVLGYFLVWEGHFDQMALTVLFLVPNTHPSSLKSKFVYE